MHTSKKLKTIQETEISEYIYLKPDQPKKGKQLEGRNITNVRTSQKH